ncbi:MAG: GGDEF domain-containing protein [Actinomycetia bacterium]|nr:GGDEF domain-containing protein [Actinomycetes bacterium]
MNRANPSQHLDALARFATAITEVASPASDAALLFLRQIVGLVDVHVCRAPFPGETRVVCRPDGDRTTVCDLPAPHWRHTVHGTKNGGGWTIGFAINSPVDHTVLHMIFDHRPSPDDLAAGEVAAGLVGRARPIEPSDGGPTDALTGLPGRTALELDLQAGFTHSGTDRVSLILADVNGLKVVNDKFGHQAGDRLLRRTATILTSAARSLGADALVARIGGDEFAIAARDVSDDQIEAALRRIDQAADELGDGTGIGRGCASLLTHPPGNPAPSVAKRGLIRLADAQLYLQKSMASGGTVRPAAPTEAKAQHRVAPRRTDPDLVRASATTAPGGSGASPEESLVHIARLVADASNAAAWWISQQDGDAVFDHSCGRTRRDALKWDEPEQPVILEPQPYSLEDFPATRSALRGGYFYASLTEGDQAERAILGYHGYRSVLAAGGIDDVGTGWLIEIYGDNLSDDLRDWSKTLQDAVSTVLTGHDA